MKYNPNDVIQTFRDDIGAIEYQLEDWKWYQSQLDVQQLDLPIITTEVAQGKLFILGSSHFQEHTRFWFELRTQSENVSEGTSFDSFWECMAAAQEWYEKNYPDVLTEEDEQLLDRVSKIANVDQMVDDHFGESANLLAFYLDRLADDAHQAAVATGWHHDEAGNLKQVDVPRAIALMHSELSEMLEGDRKDLVDEHLPHRKSIEVELADLLIRAFDFAGRMDMQIGRIYVEKRAYNNVRQDHKVEVRQGKYGKRY